VILLPASLASAPLARGLTSPPQAFSVSRELPGDVKLGTGVHGREQVAGGVGITLMLGPHGHTQVRSDRVRSWLIVPHVEQVLLLGYHRSAVHTFDPYHPVLYSRWRRNSPNPASETARASRRSRIIPATCRFSTATARLVLASVMVVL
jgi:hypothetical protein